MAYKKIEVKDLWLVLVQSLLKVNNLIQIKINKKLIIVIIITIVICIIKWYL